MEWLVLIKNARLLDTVYRFSNPIISIHLQRQAEKSCQFATLHFLSNVYRVDNIDDYIPGVIMTTAQKSPISASDKRKWFILWANSNTESIRNLAFPGAMALMVSFLMMSPLRQTKLCNTD